MANIHILVQALENIISASSDPPFSPTSCIFRVPQVLRRHNPSAYQPNVVSIGPFHDRGSEQFQSMEKVKRWYVHNFLLRMNTNLGTLITAVKENETRARDFYEKPLDHLSSGDFIEMMTFDGCFIIELFWKKKNGGTSLENDPIFKMACMFEYICHDLLLLENQLPWFILKCLNGLPLNNGDHSIDKLMLSVFGSLPPLAHNCRSYINHLHRNAAEDPLHILDLMRDSITFQLKEGRRDRSSKYSEIRLLRPATALSVAGIKFIVKDPPLDDCDSIMNIEFKDGVFMIPQLIIGELTESLFRNLIAFEQCYHDCRPLITSYAVLMDNLVGSSQDMEFLCEKKIIGNWLSAEDGSQFFNRLYMDTFLTEFHYHRLCADVNKYYQVKWNMWRERLKRDYFSNPWKAISLFAAFILLVLTAVQTVYTASSFYQ